MAEAYKEAYSTLYTRKPMPQQLNNAAAQKHKHLLPRIQHIRQQMLNAIDSIHEDTVKQIAVEWRKELNAVAFRPLQKAPGWNAKIEALKLLGQHHKFLGGEKEAGRPFRVFIANVPGFVESVRQVMEVLPGAPSKASEALYNKNRQQSRRVESIEDQAEEQAEQAAIQRNLTPDYGQTEEEEIIPTDPTEPSDTP
jgi:hypothetical protein